MKILYIHQHYATPHGRSGTRSHEQARAMMQRGHEVVMLTSPTQLLADEVPAGPGFIRRGKMGQMELVVANVPYSQHMSYPRRAASFFVFMLCACWVALTEPGIDFIFATSTPLSVGIPALVGKLCRGIPFAFEVRDLWPKVPAALGLVPNRTVLKLLQRTEELIYGHARFVVAMNDDVAQDIQGRRFRTPPTIVVPNACDTGLFRPDRDGSWFRRRHGLEGTLLCVHTGAMGFVNGLNLVLDAASELKSDARLKFVLIGEGREKENLLGRAREEALENVLILPGLEKLKLADVLATADIGLMTVTPVRELEWNCANKFFDYLASGLPVIINYEGWQGRLLQEYRCGLPSRMGNQQSFVESIHRLASDAELRAQMGRNARKLATGPLERARVVQPLLEALENFRRSHEKRDLQNRLPQQGLRLHGL